MIEYIEILLHWFKKNRTLKAYSSLEEVVDLATKNQVPLDDFYRSLANFDLSVIVPKEYAEARKGDYTFKGDELPILKGTDGSVAIFSSPERVNENEEFVGKVGIATIKGANVFAMFPESTIFVLNPFSDSAREFDPKEIKKILNYK